MSADIDEKNILAEFDLVIAGGGMAGSTLAWALSQANPSLTIAVIEQQAKVEPGQVNQASFDSRSIALAAASVDLLQQWHLWPTLVANACAIKHVKVSDRGHFGKVSLQQKDYAKDALGYVLEVEHLGNLLRAKLANCPQITWFAPTTISSLTPEQHWQLVQLDNGQQLRCKLLVIAEGGASASRKLAGINMTQQHYGQSAVITNLALESKHDFIAFERFTQHGPIALLPLTKQRYSLVYTTTDTHAKQLMQLSEPEFVEHMQQAFGYRAGVFSACGQRAMYPLSLGMADAIVQHRVALLGNSLHNLHPIAGQGFNLAMRDIAKLVQLLSQTDDPGSYKLLRAYEMARQEDIKQVATATDALVRLFSNQSRICALARNLGLLALLLCKPLKHPLAKHAMGYRS
ncbi:2-octaprenyl-6-methoxyphenyl hydroxylase [Rheinheimera sp. WS51]|uniref:2-octaprenyl-6-methoxyphenyl hydroxylase n=1 Tax=Rheinheimera sp. WS51 TaxID=3425886 RepID=UPI003D89C5BC